MTTRGFKEEEFVKVGKWIGRVAHNIDDEEVKNEVKKEVRELMERVSHE